LIDLMVLVVAVEGRAGLRGEAEEG
jgi:hypothetical protein